MAEKITTFKRIGTVVGIGPHKQGISAAGNPYDFYELAVAVPRRNWEGDYPIVSRISGDQMVKLCLTPGSCVDCLLTIEDFQYKLLAILGVV